MATAGGDANSHWGWNPLNWWSRHNTELPVTQTSPLIVNFPLEARVSIWRYLNGNDRKALKQVCKFFEIELNQIVGVDAVLHGSKLSSTSFSTKVQGLLFRSSAEKRIQDNANWIRSVLVRSLDLRQFSGVKCDTSELVKKPMLLRSLSIELDQREKLFGLFGLFETKCLDRINEILLQYNHLNRLSLNFSPFNFQSKDYRYQSYHPVVVKVVENLFNSLEFKRHLTELSICIKYHNPVYSFRHGFHDIIRRKIGTLPEDPPILDAWLQNPVKLYKIDVEMPMLPIDQLRRWKKFIDGQDQLTHLKLNFGSLHWNSLTTVLQKCAGGLELIDLTFINWYAGNVIPRPVDVLDLDENDEIGLDRWEFRNEMPTNQWFNWSAVAQPNSKLKSLRISTTYFEETILWQRQLNSTNFSSLALLNSLEVLVLVHVYLAQPQLEVVFKEIKSLKILELTAWTKTGEGTLILPVPDGVEINEDVDLEVEDYTERNQNLTNLLLQALELNRFQFMKLIDASLPLCSEQVRQSIMNQPTESAYSISWSVGTSIWSYWQWPRYPLIIKINHN